MIFGSKNKASNAMETNRGSKLPYETPRLVVHGKVSELTAAGSGARVERKRGRGSRKKRG